MTLDESFKKRITKDGEYRTTYKIKEVDNIIKEAMEYAKAKKMTYRIFVDGKQVKRGF